MGCLKNFTSLLRCAPTLLLWLVTVVALKAQDTQGLTFGEWKGSLYSINDLPKWNRYETMERNEAYVDFIEAVRYDSLVFPEMDTYGWWPGSATNNSFAMEVHTELKVSEPGCYQLTLRSDDGSKLYLNDSLIVDNGTLHQMRTKEVLHFLEAGSYEAFVWYINVLPPTMGLSFRTQRIQEDKACANWRPAEPLVLDGAALFASGAHRLSDQAGDLLDGLCGQLQRGDVKRISVVGHTDNVGTEAANLRLSKLRAGAVVSYLRNCAGGLAGVELYVEGRGDQQPVASNDNEAGRARNRRVEVTIE